MSAVIKESKVHCLKVDKDRIKNVVLSLLGAILSTGFQQLIVHPILADRYTELEYGNLLFILGIMNVIALTLGNSLGDIRMIRNAEYLEKNLSGDFNILLAVVTGVVGLVYIVAGYYIFDMSVLGAVLLGLTLMLETFASYMVMFYRLLLKFLLGLGNTIAICIGYVIGLWVAKFTSEWIAVFFVAYFVQILYLLFTTPFLTETFRTTVQFWTTVKQYITLGSSYLLKSSLTYIDRFIVYPMIGAEMVSIYSVAAVLGKCVSLGIQPIANVLLGYLSQRGAKMSAKSYCGLNAVCIGFCAVAFIAIMVVSKPIIAFLYPDYINAVLPYLFLANLTAVINALAAINQPVVLRFSKVSLQVIIQSVYAVLTICLSVLLIPSYGLRGFCFAALISAIAKVLIMLAAGYNSLRKQEEF